MREKIYRGKIVDNGDWCYGSLIELGDRKYICFADECHNIMDAGALSFEIIPETIGQFAGFLDKNGNKIFEGDIVKFDNDKRSSIIWGNGEYNQMSSFRLEKYPLFSVSIINCHLFEIIGNIHDNPELLSEV